VPRTERRAGHPRAMGCPARMQDQPDCQGTDRQRSGLSGHGAGPCRCLSLTRVRPAHPARSIQAAFGSFRKTRRPRSPSARAGRTGNSGFAGRPNNRSKPHTFSWLRFAKRAAFAHQAPGRAAQEIRALRGVDTTASSRIRSLGFVLQNAPRGLATPGPAMPQRLRPCVFCAFR
jgi:hypothetical protein